MFATLTSVVHFLARAMAYLGGGVLVAIVVLMCLSIAGRTLVPLGLQPIKGDFELLEIGVGFAVFAFLPWCQFVKGNAAVDLLKPVYSAAMNQVIDVVSDTLMFGAAVLIAWRLWAGMGDKLRYSETTFILQLPVWTAYAAAFVGAVVFVIVSAYCVIRSGRIAFGITKA